MLRQDWDVDCDHVTCTMTLGGFATDDSAVYFARARGWEVTRPEGLGPTLTMCPAHSGPWVES